MQSPIHQEHIVPTKAPMPRHILATDLDGTLLGGDEAARHRLYTQLRALGDDVMVIYVTGRGLESVMSLLSDPVLPQPSYVIADVGATIVSVPDLAAVEPLQHDIEARWPGEQTVLDRLQSFDQLERQQVPQERRCSYWVEDEKQIPARLPNAVRALGCELLLSAGRYLDILPGGVSKGATLSALIEFLGLPIERVVVAGDTLNDLSMYQIGARGIVVGLAEKSLLDAVGEHPHVHVAQAAGAGGIEEGLRHHGWRLPGDQPTPAPQPALPANAPQSTSQVVVVYHRPPYETVERDGRLERIPPRSPNGILPSLLGMFANGQRGCWVAWEQRQQRDTGEDAPEPELLDAGRYPGLRLSTIALTANDVNLFYKKFSKEAFWPILFSMPERARFLDAHWLHFVEINALFAQRVAKIAEPGAVVWLHDYNLWMVPGLLRQLRPDLRIAFFHHTAFPSADIFTIIPWFRDIIASLLQCDYVGFHIPRYVVNFIDVVQSVAPTQTLETTHCAPRFATYGCALGIDQYPSLIEVNGRAVRLAAEPVGTNLTAIRDALKSASVKHCVSAISSEMGERTCILSVERLDYVKGPLAKLDAFERLLDKHPELHEKVVLVNIVTPAAAGMSVYESTRSRIDEIVGRINGRFSRLTWTPIRYFYRALPFEEVVAYYSRADVAWITPLRDGLNLVAKEFVATNALLERDAMVVVSEFAGVSVELHGAILTNPYDGKRMEEDLHAALVMSSTEKASRIRRQRETVMANDVAQWSDAIIDAVSAPAAR
ncbi:MAG: glucosylglycerol-phosphate synthase [Pseudomonadota bacterium]|nr:glucosylglycerol-phosphate synthase [Pseudomonadota bacterium]